MSKRSNWCLLGIPDHQGVYNVHGRLGAARGPQAFRDVFRFMKGAAAVQQSLIDAGNLSTLNHDISNNYQLASEFIYQNHKKTNLSVVVGGGHDHGYSQLLGLSKLGSVACINIDAHLDVRKASPVPSSGSPFYLAIENGILNKKNFIEFGIQDHCNSPELWEYIESKDIPVVPFKTLRNGNAVKKFKSALEKISTGHNQVVISFDLDSVACAFAPGVSAPQSEGFTPSEIIEMMEISGQNKQVTSLGIFELNPLHDVEKSTARLAATAAFHFIEEALDV